VIKQARLLPCKSPNLLGLGFPEIQSKYDVAPSAFALSFHPAWKLVCVHGQRQARESVL
jgi:hypothetical protein